MIRRVLVVLGVLFLVVAAIVITSWSADPDGPDPAGGGTEPGGATEHGTEPGEVVEIPVPADAESFEVVDVTDGDTLRLRDATGAVENVRLVGIDTPEVYPEYECFGDEAEAELRRMAPIGGTLSGTVDEDPFDRYDRLLLYLWTPDGVFVNLALVEGGFAEAIRVAPNDTHYDALLAAELTAAEAGRGMWGAC